MYYLDCDDDGHHYVINHSKRSEFEAWVADHEDWELPDFVEEIGGAPNRVIFPDYKITE